MSIDRDNGGIFARDERGKHPIPAASLAVLLLGPGTSITHAARHLASDTGMTMVDVGEEGVRYYTHGRPLSTSTRLLQAQARAFANERTRLKVARDMYLKRFPGEDVAKLSMSDLRLREGRRVKALYQQHAKRTGVRWDGRVYDPKDFGGGDPINRALSVATTCLYGVTHAVIVALGLSPGLGFVHTGRYPAFVWDIADLYKADIALPVAFDVVAEGCEDIPREVRYRMRDTFAACRLIERCIGDLQDLLLPGSDIEEVLEAERVYLWDDKVGQVDGGVAYVGEPWEDEDP